MAALGPLMFQGMARPGQVRFFAALHITGVQAAAAVATPMPPAAVSAVPMAVAKAVERAVVLVRLHLRILAREAAVEDSGKADAMAEAVSS